MKRIPFQFASPATRTVPLMGLLAFTLFAGPSYAAGSDRAGAAPGSGPLMLADATVKKPASPEQAPSLKTAGKNTDQETVETRIKALHDRLKITAAQEAEWGKVAEVMRENAQKMDELVTARSNNEMSMTAVDDLKSYAEIASTHEDGTKKLIPVFQALYDDLSDEQKKAADASFHEHGRNAHERKRS